MRPMIGRNRAAGSDVVARCRTTSLPSRTVRRRRGDPRHPRRRLLRCSLVARHRARAPVGASRRPVPSIAVGPLVSLETQGGHCLQGACGGTVIIDTDGRVHTTAPENKELGALSDVLLEALTIEIEQADFEAIKSRPFTDTCPIAFDGQELIYTFTTPSGDREIDSCQVIVDPAHPLFAAADAAFASVQPR